MKISLLKSLYTLSLAGLLALPFTATAQAEEAVDSKTSGGRAMAISVEAEIVAIDAETRELTLETPMGDHVTMTAGAEVTRFSEFAVGDIVAASYIASLAGELRAPTAEEQAEPWVELDEAAIATTDMEPGAVAGRVIRAVCTIEGMNRMTGNITVLDPRGKYHVIGDVDPAKMTGVTLGTTIVLTYSEAIAVMLEKTVAAE